MIFYSKNKQIISLLGFLVVWLFIAVPAKKKLEFNTNKLRQSKTGVARITIQYQNRRRSVTNNKETTTSDKIESIDESNTATTTKTMTTTKRTRSFQKKSTKK